MNRFLSAASSILNSFRTRSLSAAGDVARRVGSWRSAPQATNKKKKSARKKLYELHTWVGFHLAVIMVVVLATGTFAVVANEIDWLLQDDMRVSPDGEEVSWQEMVDAIEAASPGVTVQAISKMQGDHFAYRASTMDAAGNAQYTHVNQWTGEVTGHTGVFTAQYFFRNLHRYLFLPSTFGLTLVCAMAVILAISLYTGLKTTRNWKTLMTRIRFSKGARIAVGDAHKAAGLWSIWFFAVIILTGIWYYAEFLGTGFEPSYDRLSEEQKNAGGDVIGPLSVTDIIDTAQAAYPELKIHGVNLSRAYNMAILVDGSVGNPIVRKRANRVYLDPTTLDVVSIQRSKDLGTLQWVNQIVDPLHFGSFGGLPVKLIWFIFGLFMTGLSATGVWLTWKRLKSRGASKMQIAALPIMIVSMVFGSLHFTALQIPMLDFSSVTKNHFWYAAGVNFTAVALIVGMILIGRLRAKPAATSVNIMLSVVVFAATASAVHATMIQKPFAPPPEVSLGDANEGPVLASAHLALSPAGEPTGAIRIVALGEGGSLNLKKTTVQLFKADALLGKERQKKNTLILVTQNISMKLPLEDLSSATDMEATFEMRSGATYTLTWSLDDIPEVRSGPTPGNQE